MATRSGQFMHKTKLFFLLSIDSNKADGTDNDVKFKIEADANNVTCETALDQFGDDWHYGKTEIWTNNKFGSCKSKLYKVLFNSLL